MAQERNRGLVLLFLLMCVIALLSAFQAIYIERLLGVGRQAAVDASRDTASAVVAVADFRGAEAGYLATGQQASYWMNRADTLAKGIGEVIDRQRAATPSPQARASFDDASGALEDLKKLDNRARGLVQADQKFVASDVIFMDSVQATTHLSQALASAHEADWAGRDAQLARLSSVRLAAIGGGMAVVLVGAWILLARVRAVSASDHAEPVAETTPARSSTSIIDPTPVAPPAPVVAPIIAAAAAPEVNLPDAAGLCVDLARVLDTRDVPALFERAANVLGAKGMVLWVTDPGGSVLRPSLTHGYAEKVVARMGGLEMDGDNATALAFRSMQPQLVGASSPTSAGALAVPLITATGCVGVLSAEIRKAKPGPDTLSVAQMIAAQLSALVAPGEAAIEAKAN
jgi:Na+-transporting methylmalonyl-CoA/oxaloacetate decarboxylase gamma subunit